MKQERKQELHTNELAQTLLEIREFLSRYGNYVIGAVVVLAILVGLFFYIRRADATALDSTYQQLRAQRLFGTDGKPLLEEEINTAIDTMRRIADEAKDPPLAQRARLQLASSVLYLCTVEPRSMTASQLQAAEEACNRLLENAGTRTVIAGSSLLHLAAIEGNRFVLDGDGAHKEKAREYLTRITTDPNKVFAGTPYMRLALDAVNELDATFQTVKLAATQPAATQTAPAESPATSQQATE